MDEFLTIKDFDSIGDVARHCDLQKLRIAVEESRIFDMIPLLCYDFAADVFTNWSLEEGDPNFTNYNALINGGTYTDSNSKTHLNLGLRRVWVYYAYARYLLINQFSDTANGIVKKDNDFSLPVPLKEVTDFSNKYRAMGREAFESVQAYLCNKREDFQKFNACNCQLNCGCSGSCTCGKTKKLTGFKFKTIAK